MNIRATTRSFACAALVLLAMSACIGRSFRGSDDPALVIFTNDALDQATVYIVGPASDFRRIGVVSAGRTDTLKVSSELVTRGTVNIVVRMLAQSAMPQTGSVSMAPGEAYVVRLPPDARMLTFLPAP